MEIIVDKCCGIDVHQASIVVCVLITVGKRAKKEIRTFSTFTRDLLAMAAWLKELGVTHVGMESTGVYWKPVYAVLEGEFDITVGNAQHIKNVPGRKTDVKDSEWLARLVRHGLIRKSFVPPPDLRALRDLLRYRRKLVETRSAEQNRVLKVLELANIKLSSVASDVFGASGLAMLRRLAQGDATIKEMAELAKGSLRKKIPELELALDGRVQEHHRFMLQMQLDRFDRVQVDIANIEQHIDRILEPYKQARERLDAIPGVDVTTAAVIIAEMGVDMSVFADEHKLAAWAGVCPGNNESAGKHRSTRTRKGNIALKTALVEAANAASKKKGSYYKDKFHRLKARRGHKRALVAIAHKILVAAYHILKDGTEYRDLGEGYLDRLNQTATLRRLTERIERLGFDVALTAKSA